MDESTIYKLNDFKFEALLEEEFMKDEVELSKLFF